jgi:hypothetical protein
LTVQRTDVERLWPFGSVPAPQNLHERGAAPERLADKSRKPQKRGRKPWDWKSVEDEVNALMDHHGELSPDDLEWNCQERLLERLEDKFGISRSSLAEHVPAMVDRWRIRKSGN